jgi:hypothetical protein
LRVVSSVTREVGVKFNRAPDVADDQKRWIGMVRWKGYRISFGLAPRLDHQMVNGAGIRDLRLLWY